MQVIIRLSKYLSQNGISSRRKADELIKTGRVWVNNNIVYEPYYQVKTDSDVVCIDGRRISETIDRLYFALYKPVHYISDLNYKEHRKLARDIIDTDVYIFPVGRLDYDSEGLMIFTNDGEIANVIMHPRFGIEKEYVVTINGTLSKTDMLSAKKGLMIDNKLHRFAHISLMRKIDDNGEYRIILHEGRNRIIRKVCHALGHEVIKLKRIRIGNIHLGRLKPGEYRIINEHEILPFKIVYKESLKKR